jgi:hypothetical protein
VIIALLLVSGCNNTPVDIDPTVPIFISLPDSNNTIAAPGKTVKVQIKFTTDRPMSYVSGMYERDTTRNPSHVYTYPDTFFYKQLDTIRNLKDPTKFDYVNKYTYDDTFHIPSKAKSKDIFRFRITTEAKFRKDQIQVNPGDPIYPIYYSKEFKITIR